jgi:hypothetical protein
MSTAGNRDPRVASRSGDKIVMHRYKLLLLMAFAGVLGANPGQAAHPPSTPKLVIESLEHAFGTVNAGTPLSYTFKVKNAGKAQLQIISVKPSCGCTKGAFDSLTAPGKEGKITLTIAHTEKYKGATVKTATVTTNDPDHQTFTLTMRADFVAAEPDSVSKK